MQLEEVSNATNEPLTTVGSVHFEQPDFQKTVFISEIEVHVKKNVMGLCSCSLVIPYHAYEKQRAFLLASLLFPRLSFKVQHSLGFMKYTLLA
jgi:hypothetical protein